MKRFYHLLKKPHIWMAAVLIVAFSFPIVGKHVDAASSDPGFVIHADSISGKMLPPSIVVQNGQPLIRFQYESATIHGLTLTHVSQSEIGPITLKVQASVAKATMMTVLASSYSFGGACVRLGEDYPQLVLKDVTLVAEKQTADHMDFQGLQVKELSGDHGLKRPPVPGLLGGLASTGSSTLQNTIEELMSGHAPLLQCNAPSQEKAKDNQNNSVQKTVDQTKDTVDQTVDQTKDTVQKTVDQTKDEVNQVVDQTKDTVNQVVDQTKDKVTKTVDQAGDTIDKTVHQIGDHAGDIVGGAGDAVGQVADDAGDTTGDLINDAGKTVDDITHGNGEDVPDDVNQTVHHAVNHVDQLTQDLLKEVGNLGDQASGTLSDILDQKEALGNMDATDQINQLQKAVTQDVKDLTKTNLFGLPIDPKQHLNDLKDDLTHLKKLKGNLQDIRNNTKQDQQKLDQIQRQLTDVKSQNVSSGKLEAKVQDVQDQIQTASNKLNNLNGDLSDRLDNIHDVAKNARETMHEHTGVFDVIANLLGGMLGDVNDLIDNLLK